MIEKDYEKLYTVKELAASNQLRISKSTIWREIEKGKLSYYQFGGQIFISERHVQEYLASCERRRTSKPNYFGSSTFLLAMR